MSLKAKLISSISAFCLVVALLVVGVLAVNPANVNMGGNINFTATDVMATINANVTGIEGSHTFTEIKFDQNTQEDAATNDSWKGLNFAFKDKKSTITLTITIKNDSTERDFTVAYTAPVTIENVTTNSTYSLEDVSDQTISGPITVGAGKTATIKVTFGITDNAKSVEGTWNIGMILTNVAA